MKIEKCTYIMLDDDDNYFRTSSDHKQRVKGKENFAIDSAASSGSYGN